MSRNTLAILAMRLKKLNGGGISKTTWPVNYLGKIRSYSKCSFQSYFSRPYNFRLLSAIHGVANKLYSDYFRCVSSPPRSEKWKPYFLFCAEVPLLSRAPSRRGLVSEDIKDLLPQQKSVAWKESLFVWRIPLLQHWISFFDQRMFKLNGWNQILESPQNVLVSFKRASDEDGDSQDAF